MEAYLAMVAWRTGGRPDPQRAAPFGQTTLDIYAPADGRVHTVSAEDVS